MLRRKPTPTKRSPFLCSCYCLKPEWLNSSNAAMQGHPACLRLARDRGADSRGAMVEAFANNNLTCVDRWNEAERRDALVAVGERGRTASLWLAWHSRTNALGDLLLLRLLVIAAAGTCRFSILAMADMLVPDAHYYHHAFTTRVGDEEKCVRLFRYVRRKAPLTAQDYRQQMVECIARGWVRALRLLRKWETAAAPSEAHNARLHYPALSTATTHSCLTICRMLCRWYSYEPDAFDWALCNLVHIQNPDTLWWLKRSGATKYWQSLCAIPHRPGPISNTADHLAARNVETVLSWIPESDEPGREAVESLAAAVEANHYEQVARVLRRWCAA